MRNALDPMISLATAVHSQPGVYALLVGSGASTAAGIPTGWGVVTQLVRRAAAAANPDDLDAADRAAGDPAAWWNEHGDGQPLGYSGILKALGSTPAARRGLLAAFFEPSEDDAEEGLKVPGPAHHAIAQLVKRGFVRVIITTNFDRLLERALEEAGVPPQVISRPDSVAGMTPLPHAPVTVIKLHGDYSDLAMRNTVEELAAYPPRWRALLDGVLNDYGLLVCGWSATWDPALVGSMERVQVRRYPLYWDSRSSKGSEAQRLLAQHRGQVVEADTADSLFADLLSSLTALDRLAEPPLTTELAVARLKRLLPDPVRHIELHDLVMGVVDRVVLGIADVPLHIPGLSAPRLEEILGSLLESTVPLLRMMTTAVYHDRQREHLDLYSVVLQRLMQARTPPVGMFMTPLDAARHYPALLCMRASGIIASQTGRDDVMLALFRRPTWRDPQDPRSVVPALYALDDYRVIDSGHVNAMPRWNGSTLTYPVSHLLRADLHDVIREWLPSFDDYTQACDRYEYRAALARVTVRIDSRPVEGEFILDYRWVANNGPREEVVFRDEAGQADDDWVWWPLVGGPDGLDGTLLSLRTDLQQMRGSWR